MLVRATCLSWKSRLMKKTRELVELIYWRLDPAPAIFPTLLDYPSNDEYEYESRSSEGVLDHHEGSSGTRRTLD